MTTQPALPEASHIMSPACRYLHTRGDTGGILSTMVTAAMLEVKYATAV